jgi:hypothetical protein
MTAFTATLEPLDPSLILPEYKNLVKQIKPGLMLVLTFPVGTTSADIHKVRTGLVVSSMRLQGCGKIKSHMKDATLYVWLTEDNDRIAALSAIQ